MAWIAHRPQGPRADRYFNSSSIVRSDAPSRIEVAAAQGIDRSFSIEVLPTAITNASHPVEFAVGLLSDTQIDCEAGGVALSLAINAGAPLEWLSSGALVAADWNLAIEVDNGPSTVLVSIESGPARIRLLATLGRVRLLRSN
jgi:hypothetical protein